MTHTLAHETESEVLDEKNIIKETEDEDEDNEEEDERCWWCWCWWLGWEEGVVERIMERMIAYLFP